MDTTSAADKILTWLADQRAIIRTFSRPEVTLSYAQSLDGCLALVRGQPFALSGEEARKVTHTLRAAHEGILVGVGTVLSDNPRLNVRFADGPDPVPVVLDTHLRIPLDCRLLAREQACAIIAHGPDVDEAKKAHILARGGRLLECRLDGQGKIDLIEFLARVGSFGIRSVMVEGGASVISAFLAQALANLAVVTVTPLWLGGVHVVETPMQAGSLPVLAHGGCCMAGRDLMWWGRLAAEGQ
jgi:riboflavin-specific deaminase-like protein